MNRPGTRSGQTVAELLRLGIVLLLTAGGYAVGGGVDDVLELRSPEATQLVTSVLGALVGYVLGGIAGRAVVQQVDTAAVRLDRVPSSRVVAAALGAAVGALVGVTVLLPVLLLPYQRFTVPVALLVVLALVYAGGRLGALRGPDLARFVGLRGRLEVSTPSRGAGVKVVDTSALVDGRLVEVARAGFLEGTLVIPTVVLHEVQQLADSSDQQVRRRGRRALDLVRALQDEGLVTVEVTEDDDARYTEVDAKLSAIARARQGQLVTCDAALARVAEIGGVRALSLHRLAEAVRPPVLPGDELQVRPVKLGREPGQAVAYLDDGTMIVIEGADGTVGRDLRIDVTSIVNHRQGRMLFAAPRRANP